MKKLSPFSRIVIALSSLVMIATFYTPLWKIQLKAPQYPEGLEMKIWLNNITGQIDIINGLNHYIGMKKISVASFPEFEYMPLIVGSLIVAGLIVALIGRRVGLIIYLCLLGMAAGVGLYDYYQWSYDYGHNLDPMAPIQIPGLTYQPPLIGYKNLLNFEAFSFPDTGGLIFFSAGMVIFLVLIFDFFSHNQKEMKHSRVSGKYSAIAVACLCSFQILSCTSGPVPISYGKEDCQHCRMTLVDDKFGCEIVNKNGKAYKFDDIGCMMQFSKSGDIAPEDIKNIYVVDFIKTKELIPVENAQFLSGEAIKSPMGSHLAAFNKKENINQTKGQLNAQSISWNEIQEKY